MANKDGIVSIGFDYKKELDEVCATIEKELNSLGGDINLSDGIKKQMTEIKKMITDMKKDIGSSFDKITETKLDTKTFESFKKDVNKRIREINKEVTTLKEQFSTLDGSANVNGIVQQFANLKKHVEDSNASISEFINNSEKLGKSVIISPSLDTDSFKNEIAEIKSLLTKLGKEDFDFGYSNKSAKELGEIARELVFDYRDLSEEIEETKNKLNSMNNSDKGFKEQEAHLSKLSLELIECGRKIDDVFGSENSQKVDWEKYLNINEIDEISKYVAKKTEEIRANAQQIINSIATSNNISSTNKNNGLDNTNRSNNIEVHISTKQSTINKQLDEMIDNLQQRAANKPIIAPVKLRVDSEYEKTTKDASASALTENQINEARKEVENVIPGLEKAFNNSMRIATNKAVENAKESIKAVREFFETNPITVHLTIPEDERLKIGKSILAEDGKTTVDISGQVDKARKSVKGLSEDLEKSQLLIKENAQNAKNLSLEKLVNSLSETMTQFSELKGIISSIQNMENTIARASGISSTNELVEQWSVVEKTIINATKLDGDFRKNANIGKIVSEYQKYIDMGGTNTLSSIDKIKDNETTINSILSKMKELKSQDIENSSIQKLSVDLDGVIAKFDELISTVKTATNALYKIIKQGSVSDLDKQWSSISNKFKSIADESGKINLSKQKTDIKELMDMYQKYENAGGTNSLMSLTDNVETLRKLDKEYQKLNQTQSVDNSSTIEKESESFKGVEKSVDSLTTAIGDTKVQAINVEATAMEDAAEREIMAIRSILDNLDLVVSRLKDIKGIKLPKIEVKNVDVVEKAVESLENTGNKSNISSENSIVESQNKIQEEIKETRESLHLLSDEYGNLIYANRGVNHTIGAGLNSNRYHGGTFWTISKELAANYGSKIEVANLSMNKPFEIDNKGYNWDEIELYYNQLEELKKYVEKVKSKTEEIQIAISNIADPEEDFKLPTFDIDNEGNILSFGENSIEYIDSIEKLRDALWGCVDLGDPKIQQSITNLYDCLQTYARMNQLLNKGELNTNEVVEIAKNLGYDGVIFKNIMDGSDEVTDIFVTLEQNQVHYVETLDNIAIKEELAKSKAEKIANSRKELYNNLKNLSDSDLNTIVSDFQIGVVPNIWEEFLSTQDFNDSFDNIKANLLKYVSDLKSEFSENLSKIDSPIKDVFQGDEASKINEVVEATNNLADAENRLNIVEDKKSAQKYWQGRFKDSISDMTKTNDELVKMNKYYSDLEKMSEKLVSAQNKVDNANIDIDKLSKRDVQSDNYIKAIENYKNSITELQNYIKLLNNNGIQSQDDIDELNRLQKAVDEVSKSIKNMSASEKGTNIAKSSTVFLKIEELRDKYKGMSKDMQKELDRLERKFAGLGDTIDTGRAIGELKQFETQLIKTGTATNSLWSAMKDKAFYNFANQLGTMFSFYDLIRYTREGIDTIREFDDGLTKISYTMDMTKSQLDNLGNSVLDMASDMKSSIDDAMQVAQIYANMQTSAEEIQRLSEPTLILSNLSGFDSSTIADDIQAVTQQFDILAEDSMHIADVYDYISRNIAVDYSKGLNAMAEGLQVAGSTAKQAGLSYEQTASIIAKAVEKTRLEGSQVGNGLKTIMTRLSKVGELSEEVDNETLSQASESLKKVGIEVYNLDGSYREFDVIMGELAGKWDNLTDAEKSNISFNIAATRQTNLLSAVLSNFSDSMQLAEEATNANGSALENQQKYMESFSGHLQSLETEAKIAWLNILDSETLKDGVNLLTGLVKVVGQLVDTFGLLGTVAGIGGIVAGFKNIGRPKMFGLYKYADINMCSLGY